MLLEKVVSEGTGKMPQSKAFFDWRKNSNLPRLFQEVQISILHLFLGFTPADNPKVLGLVIINDPQGVYYGGTIAAPVMKEIFEKCASIPWN